MHRSRFTKPGDYISLELAGFPVLIILGKDRIARAFHNVCRHRAYTITKKPIGSSLVLGCRYHGWSYDTMGNLVKAPQFDGIEGFNKSENGLFKIHTCTDRAGFIHINLDAGESLQAPSCEDLVGHAAEHDITAKSRWLTGWELCGAFNWKTIGKLILSTSTYKQGRLILASGASDRTGIGTPSPSSASASVMEFLLSVFRGPGFAVDGCHTFLADPTTVILVFPYSNIWATMTGLPVSASETTIRCDIFSRDGLSLPPATEEALKLYTASQAQALQHLYDVVKSIRPTEEPAQVSLLKEHLRLERLAGCEIFPGRREEGRSEGFCKAEKRMFPCNSPRNVIGKADNSSVQ